MRGTIIASIRGTKPLERIYNARFPRARLNGTEEEGRGRKRRRRNALLPRKQKKNRVSSPFTARSFALMYSTSRLFLCAFEGKKKKISFLQSEKAGINFKVEAEFFERRHVSSDENERKNASPPVHCVHFACNVRAPFKPFSFLFHA